MQLLPISIPYQHRRYCLKKASTELDPKTLLIYMSCKTGINIDVNYGTQVLV